MILDEFVEDLLKYPVDYPVHLTVSWLQRKEPLENEMGSDVFLSPEIIMERTLRELSPGIYACGFALRDHVEVRIRDINRNPKEVARVVDDIMSKVGGGRYTGEFKSLEHFDLYSFISALK